MLEKILVFDTETTGFRSDDEVLTLAVVDGAGKTVVDGMYAPVSKKEWPDAEKVNRISPAMVADCAPILTHRAELERLFNDPETLLVGYNIEFDIRLLGQPHYESKPARCDARVLGDAQGAGCAARRLSLVEAHGVRGVLPLQLGDDRGTRSSRRYACDAVLL